MSAKLLNGRLKAIELQEAIKHRILAKVNQGMRSPGLAVLLVGDDPASEVYVKNKHAACKAVGIKSESYFLDKNTSEASLLKLIDDLNANPNIDGILVQLPLPKQINVHLVLERIHPNKDVDGFHPYNMGRLLEQSPLLRPCTPAGIMLLLEHYEIPLSGLEATVVGVSNIVGRPMILELMMAGCTVTACHRRTRNLQSHVSKADLLVVATGAPKLIPGNWIKPGAIVVDVGINRLSDGKLMGDVDMESAKHIAAWITPVPGGVGPMTVAALLQNTLLAYEMHLSPEPTESTGSTQSISTK